MSSPGAVVPTGRRGASGVLPISTAPSECEFDPSSAADALARFACLLGSSLTAPLQSAYDQFGAFTRVLGHVPLGVGRQPGATAGSLADELAG